MGQVLTRPGFVFPVCHWLYVVCFFTSDCRSLDLFRFSMNYRPLCQKILADSQSSQSVCSWFVPHFFFFCNLPDYHSVIFPSTLNIKKITPRELHASQLLTPPGSGSSAHRLRLVAVDTCDRCQLPKGTNVTLTSLTWHIDR